MASFKKRFEEKFKRYRKFYNKHSFCNYNLKMVKITGFWGWFH